MWKDNSLSKNPYKALLRQTVCSSLYSGTSRQLETISDVVQRWGDDANKLNLSVFYHSCDGFCVLKTWQEFTQTHWSELFLAFTLTKGAQKPPFPSQGNWLEVCFSSYDLTEGNLHAACRLSFKQSSDICLDTLATPLCCKPFTTCRDERYGATVLAEVQFWHS